LTGLGEAAQDTFPDESGQPEAIAASDASPGRHLSEARKSRGLSIADVAQAIKFSPRQIEAIESDDFDKLAGATFVRGFMRSYAKFLHIDPQPLLAILDQHSPQADATIRVPQDTGAALPQTGNKPAHIPYLLLLALLATIIAAAFFWTSTRSIPIAKRSMDVPSPVVSAPVVAQPVTTAVEPAPVGPGGPSLQYAPGMQGAPTAQSAQSAQSDAMAQAALPIDPEHHLLTFTFADKSWVEVKDASQRIIFAQINDPGSRQVVSGKPPFALVIGNASNVQLQYDERQIDLRPHIRVDVARLNLE
jgi:cytoskeleton protein RodZ